MGLPGSASGKETICQCRRLKRHKFNPWVRKIPWRRAWQPTPVFLGFPGDSAGKESACNTGDLDSNPGSGRSLGEANGYQLQYSCLENPHGQRSLVGYSPKGCKESDMMKHLSPNLLNCLLVVLLLLFSHSVMSNSFVTPWSVAHRTPLSMGFPRQDYWDGLPL